MKKTCILKKLWLLPVLVIVVFGGINAYWYLGYESTYNRMVQNFELQNEGVDASTAKYVKNVDDYHIEIKKPEYLGTGGFISMFPNEAHRF